MFSYIRRIFFNFREYFVLAVLLLVSLLILSFNDHPASRNVRAIALGVFGTVNSAAASVTGIFSSDGELARLRQRNAELMYEVNMLREYGLENRELKNMLAFTDTTDFPLVPASVISKQVSKARGLYVINAGEEKGIEPGMPVINGEGLIGIVSDVSGHFSSVKTLHHNKLNIAVEDQRSGVYGILVWEGTKSIIKNIPSDYDVKVGDRIVTSQFSTILPPSIPVGIVSDKEVKISGLLSNVIVKHFVDFNGIENVFVMKVKENSRPEKPEFDLVKE